MRTVVVSSLFAAALLAAAPALAQAPTQYTWTGYGEGQGNCTRYKMTIDVTVTGTQVKGNFQQEGRTARFWEAVSMDGAGNFRTRAAVQNGTIDVKGQITPASAMVVLDGYCKFNAKTLTKK